MKMLDDRVLVEPMEAKKKTLGGIVLPETATVRERSQCGRVLVVGPGRLLDDGKRAKPFVAVGDKALYNWLDGSEIEIGERELKIIRESDILAVVVE